MGLAGRTTVPTPQLSLTHAHTARAPPSLKHVPPHTSSQSKTTPYSHCLTRLNIAPRTASLESTRTSYLLPSASGLVRTSRNCSVSQLALPQTLNPEPHPNSCHAMPTKPPRILASLLAPSRTSHLAPSHLSLPSRSVSHCLPFSHHLHLPTLTTSNSLHYFVLLSLSPHAKRHLTSCPVTSYLMPRDIWSITAL